MLRVAARGIKQAVGPATFFGCGYCYQWSQNRSETRTQLAALTVAGGLSHVLHSLRSIAPELPEDSWPQEKLKNLERSELRLVMEAVSKCEEKEVDCAELRRIALKHVCFAVTQNSGAISELSAVSEGLEGGMVELLGFVDRTVTKLADEGFADVSTDSETLTALTAILRNVVESKSWHESLGTETIIKVARTTCVATQWCASWGQRANVESSAVGRIVGIAPLDFSVEEQHDMVTRLAAVWRALSQDGPAKVLRSRAPSVEAGELLKDLHARYRAIEERPRPPAILCGPPVLPAALKQSLAVALGHSAPKVAPPAPAPKVASAPSPKQVAPKVDVHPKTSDDSAASSGWLSSTFNALRWTFLAALTVGVISQDGLGILNFHVLPTELKDVLWDILRAQVAKVDAQIARASPPKYLDELPVSEYITLGPNLNTWGADSTYIQPKFTGPAGSQQ